MSQLTDFFACSRPTIEKWTDALEQQDEELLERIQSEMPRFLPLRNVGYDEFLILAQLLERDDFDAVKAVGQQALVKAVSEEEGPWVTGFSQATVEAVAGMSVDVPLIERWVKAVAKFNGLGEERSRELLTTETAESFKELCSVAVEKGLGVFACFYG